VTNAPEQKDLGGCLAGTKLIVVSNREPYVHKRSGLRITTETPAGGLSSALDDVLRMVGGTWVAWGSGNADRDAVDGNSRLRVPPGDPRYTLRRVWLRPQEVDNYYHGYANQVLWPLCHITLDRVTYRKNFWDYYERANRAFAEAALEEADERSLVWVQDYQLCLVPQMLRERSPRLTLLHFWHIPWPDWSVFRICPQARQVLEGLLANDLIGFQVPLFARNFLDCVRECLDADVDYQLRTVTYRDRTTRLEAFPISVDYARFSEQAGSRRALRTVEAVRRQHRLQGVRVGIGVDRLEYTKALIKRLQAIELFFERYASFRRKFTFIQIAVPTRMREPYLSYGKAVEEMIGKINQRFSQGTWQPIIYLSAKIDHDELAAYYRLADVAVISSVYDGMNLVAKEYVACQVDGQGVLILSELAGAAEELEGSLLVNPYNIEEFSDRIRQALIMLPEEKRARMTSLRRHVQEHDITKWVDDVLTAACQIAHVKERECLPLFERQEEAQRRLGSRDVILFLDFDGTLAPIADTPDRVVLHDEVRAALDRLSRVTTLAIVSGRSLGDLRERVGIDGIAYAGNHGAEILAGDDLIRAPGVERAAQSMRRLLDRLREDLAQIPGVLIEDKGITASVHFRLVDPSQEGEVLRIFWDAARGYTRDFRMTTGKKVLEVRPQSAWNKGQAVARIMELQGRGRMPLYVGDDTTDEDAFRAIKGSGLSISVGPNPEADYYLRDQAGVAMFLDWLSDVLSGRRNAGTATDPGPAAREEGLRT
jgi:trehalose 6-phosphate synthase/phosphatase